MSKIKCDLCYLGTIPLYTQSGKYWADIDCPQCDGEEEIDDPNAPEPGPADLPPPSTAAKIRSIDELRAWQAKEYGL